MNLKRLALALFVVAWIVAITYSVTAGGTSPERLDDANARTVESNCRAAQRALAPLPQLESARRRPRRPRDSTARTRSWVAWCSSSAKFTPTRRRPRPRCGRGSATGNASSSRATTTPSDLRTKGRDARFIEPAYKGIEPIADKMNDWILEQGTRTNTCNTDALQAEVVNGPRKYETAE